MRVFTICTAQPLIIGTAEFWKPAEAGAAFDLMHAATKYELAERFEENTDPNWIRMTLVGHEGERVVMDDFLAHRAREALAERNRSRRLRVRPGQGADGARLQSAKSQ